jgi:hypothetical protein
LARCGKGTASSERSPENPLPNLVVYLLCTRCFWVER